MKSKRIDKSIMSHSPRLVGFSLMELLIVITIIGLLVAILMPAVSMVRANALALQCGANLRQVSLGLQGYALDWRGVQAPLKTYAAWAGKNPADFPYDVHWTDLIATYVDNEAKEFGGDNVTWGCPNWDGAGVGAGAGGVNGGFTGYGRNVKLLGQNSPGAPWGYWTDSPVWAIESGVPNAWRYFRNAAITQPTIRPLVTESSQYYAAGDIGAGLWAVNNDFTRHRGGRLNTIFCDGHLEKLSPNASAEAFTLP
jgi:prepilin-type N-terminal cleavage/methylation domain-containing protein/prepilin-type processing-associated H-X9-DG protein